jgi:tRNA A22 N-methylase
VSAPAYLGNRLTVIAAAIARTVRALADIGLQFGIVKLRIVAQQTALNAMQIAFHPSLLPCGLEGAD